MSISKTALRKAIVARRFARIIGRPFFKSGRTILGASREQRCDKEGDSSRVRLVGDGSRPR
jgi:hypothetical protein